MKNHSLLLIDDDQKLGKLLNDNLELEGFEIDYMDNGESGLSKARSGKHYDLILLDVMLPLMNGFDVLKNLRQSHVTPVILLTAKEDEFERIYGLELGADDYLAKPFNTRELLARIKALLRRVSYINNGTYQAVLRVGPLEIMHSSGTASFYGAQMALTAKEFSILQLLMVNKGKMTRKCDISEAVFGRRLEPYDRSIDMHVSNLRKKIACHSNNELIRTIRGGGYMMLPVWAG